MSWPHPTDSRWFYQQSVRSSWFPVPITSRVSFMASDSRCQLGKESTNKDAEKTESIYKMGKKKKCPESKRENWTLNGNRIARSADLSCINCNRSASITLQDISAVQRQDYMLDTKLSEQCFCPSNKQTNAITSIMPVGESLQMFARLYFM